MPSHTTAALHPPGAIYEQAALFSAALEASQEGASSRMLEAWAKAYHRARVEYDALLAKVAAAKAAGEPMSPAWLYQRDRLKSAISTTKVEMARYADAASAETKAAQWSAVQASVKHAAKLGQTAMTGAGLHGGFDSLDEAHLRHLVGFLADGSPLDTLFSGLANETAAQLTDALTVGLAHGKGIDWMTRQVDTALDMPRWRAETIMRTESQRVYRATANATYQANAEVLSSWVWTAHLDSRTCPCCVVMDGTEHPIGSVMDGHPRCRCVMVPRTKTWEQLGIGTGAPDTRPPVRSGKAWLEAQPDDVQRELLGPAKFKAWKSGQISLDDVVARTHTPAWGTMRRERSLREINRGLNPNYVDAVEVHVEPPPLTANPRAVRAILKANTPDAIGEALAGDDLDAQQRVNYQAAHYANATKAGFDVALPEPDHAKADKAAEKMATAAITKGYPSKGYSQTVAIYKAQANGTPGTKVGVVKSLTWQQKLTARAALEKHHAWLADWTAKQAEQHEKGKAIIATLKADLNSITSNSQLKMFLDASKKQIDVLEPGPERDRTLAAWQAISDQEYDALSAALTKHLESADWVDPDDDPTDPSGILTIGPDGWGTLMYPNSGAQTVTPKQVVQIAEDWKPFIQTDPAKVKGWVQNFTTTDGTLDTAKIESMEELLNDPNAPWVPQAKAEIVEAVAEAKATLPWPPDDETVEIMVELLNEGSLTPDEFMQKAAEQPNNPQYHANIKAAIDKYQAQAKSSSGQALLDQLFAIKDEDDAEAPVGVAPDAAGLTFTGKVLGTHGAKVYEDAVGEKWLFKPPKMASDGFLATLDEAASRLQAKAGLTAPDTFVVTLDGKRGSIQRMFNSHNAFSGGFRPEDLTAPDLAAVQREHVLDWLLSNHDGHLEQFQRLPDGTLVGIDKGQAFRWMGQDRLAWDFHPNAAYGAPEPVYNALWREFAQGRDVDVLDPHIDGPLRDQIEAIQAISDDDLRDLLRPYAEQAAAQGKLAVRQSQPGLTKPTIPPNDVEAFLDAVVARKNNLQDDFNDLYDRAAKARAKALPGWKPTKAKPTTAKKATHGTVASWQGAPAPTLPDPPVEPDTSDVAKMFDPWLADVKARYKAGPGKTTGKTLEQSNNWARVRRVIDDHDETALQELADRQYLDDALLAEGRRVIKAAKAAKADALKDYQRERDAWQRARKAWSKDMADWRDANGIRSAMVGMDDGVVRHSSQREGTTWADKHWKANRWTEQERTKLRYYTSSAGARSLNSTGRRLEESGRDASAWGGEAGTVKIIDTAMGKQPVPEDVIVNRGTGLDAFVLVSGRRASGADRAELLQTLPGTIQREWGYLSTSVGHQAGFGGAAQIKLRVPAGTRAAYVEAFSQYKGGSEVEMVLDRGMRYYVHAVYEARGQLIVEAEIVDEDFTVPLNPDGSPVLAPSATPWK